ncbi:hypothetical protein [Arthrobacter sp. H20]|uniref:hypothetical protein n=1 Tax=Arthrobacter sp. H20 TaxID=1267981 RepID=UPI00047EDFA3|nr:hypothetical protein [Arthrobacter sp. H20]
MLALMVVAAATLVIGFAVRFADRRHQRYGALILPLIAVGFGMVAWVALQFTGLGYNPELFWLSWLLPIVASAGVCVAAAWWLGRHRETGEAEALRRVSDT